MRRVTIVGGSLAALRAAETLRREGFDGTLRIVSAEDHLPIDRPPLSKQVLSGTWEPAKAALRGADELDADWLLGRTAVALDVASTSVRLDDGSVLDGDGVILATGASPRRVAALEGAFELRTVADCLALRSAFADASRIVVVGAGFIGSEVAATARGMGLDVTIVEMLAVPLERAIGAQLGMHTAQFHRDHGVDVRLGVSVAGLAPGGGVALSDGTVVEGDVVVVGIGVAPTVDWLSSSGVAIDNGVVCDSRCRVAPGVVAAGDVARWDHPHYGLLRVEHWTNASEMGSAAALGLLRGDEAPEYAPVPYFWSDQYGAKIQCIGHPSATDDVMVEEGSLEDGRFVATYRSGGRLTGVLLWSWPGRMMHWMSELEAVL